MADLGKRIPIVPNLFGRRLPPLCVGELVHASYKGSGDFWSARIIAVRETSCTVQYEDGLEKAELPLGKVRRLGANGDYGNDCNALPSAPKRAKKTKKKVTTAEVEPPALLTWRHEGIKRTYVQPFTDGVASVPARTMLVYGHSLLIDGDWVEQPDEVISLRDAVTDEILADIHTCAYLKFQRDLYLATPTEKGMEELLGDEEPMVDEEEVLEGTASLGEEMDRQAVYKLRSQRWARSSLKPRL